MGRDYGDYFLPLLSLTRGLGGMKMEESMPDSDITLEYLCDNVWLVGSPETVARKIRDLHTEVGGFGGLLIGAVDEPDPAIFTNVSLPADLLYLFRILVGLGIILVRMRACFDNWEMNKRWIVEGDQLYGEHAWDS